MAVRDGLWFGLNAATLTPLWLAACGCAQAMNRTIESNCKVLVVRAAACCAELLLPPLHGGPCGHCAAPALSLAAQDRRLPNHTNVPLDWSLPHARLGMLHNHQIRTLPDGTVHWWHAPRKGAAKAGGHAQHALSKPSKQSAQPAA